MDQNKIPSGKPIKIHEKSGQYGEKEAVLVPFLVDDGGIHDSVLIFPGGGYNHVSVLKEGESVAKAFNAQGLNAFYLDYRVEPCHGKEFLCDAVRAVQYVRYHNGKLWNIGEKLALMGFSAGGHLVLMETEHGSEVITGDDNVSRETFKPEALLLCYPVVTFTDPYAHRGSRGNFLGSENAECTELREKYSAERHVDPDFPPVFFWHCEGDASVPVQNSLMLRDALIRAGVDHQLILYPNGAHGLGLAPDDEVISSWFQSCVSWLNDKKFVGKH